MKTKFIILLTIFLNFYSAISQENISFYNLRDYVVQGQNYSSIITPKHKVTVSLPLNVGIGGIVEASARLKWDAVEGARGYKIYWRETTSSTWDHSRFVPDITEFTLDGIVIDNFFFGVSAVGLKGHESPVVFPNSIMR